MAALVTTQSGTLLSAIQNVVVKGRSDHSNAAFSFRIYIPDANYPNDWTILDGVSNTLDLGCRSFTVDASSEAAAATEAARIYKQIVDEIGVIRSLDISDLKSGQIWSING